MSYYTEGYTPNAKPVKELYYDANVELIKPFPATPLRNFPKLNMLTGGLRPFEFSILCGSTGSGKTTLVANLSRTLVEQEVPHFVASVETGHTDFVKRVISAMAGRDWNTGDPVPVDELKKFDTHHGRAFQSETLQLSLYENRFSVETLMADIAWMVEKKGVKVAFIDNLNFFLEVTKSSEQIVEMDRVIHNLIIFCKHVPVHLVMVMHPKKTEGSRIDSELDIKGSSTAVQEAHNVFLWNRPHPDLIQEGFARPSDRELTIAKMRRKGKYVRSRLIFRSADSVSYTEGEICGS